MSGASERANGRANGSVIQSGFLVDLALSAYLLLLIVPSSGPQGTEKIAEVEEEEKKQTMVVVVDIAWAWAWAWAEYLVRMW